MKLEKVKQIVNENYDDYESVIFKMKGIIKSLRKTYDDKTIEMAFKKVMKSKSI